MMSGGSRARGDGEVRATLLATAVYVVITLFLAWPLARDPARGAMPGDPDTDLFMWTLAWNTHALRSQPLSIFDANIYHPHRRTLAFSENLIGSLPFAAPVLWLGGSPLLALNLVALASIVLSGTGGYLLGRRIGLGRYAAFVCGMVCAFAPSRFYRLGQLHLTSIQWIPFCLAFLHGYLDRGRRRDLLLALAFFSFQALASGHGAVFLLIAIIVLLGYRFGLGERVEPVRRLRDFGVAGALLLSPAVFVIVPYRAVQAEHGLRRTLVDWETTPQSFISSVSSFHTVVIGALGGAAVPDAASAHLFPGFLAVLLAGLALTAPAAARLAGLQPRAPSGRALVLAALTGGALIACVLALYVSFAGPVRIRVAGVLFSARHGWRVWAIAAAIAAGCIAMSRSGPLDVAGQAGNVLRSARAALPRWRTAPVAPYALLTGVSVLLSAGPPLGLWPYVYDLPGFNFIRVPSRFMLLGTIGVAVLAGIGAQHLLRLRRRPRLVGIAAALVIAAECFTRPLPGHRDYGVHIPAADRWLATQPTPLVVAEVPINHYSERLQSTYMLHSMSHWQKTIHGHSGVRSGFHVGLFATLRNFPSDASLQALRDVGVTHVVLHENLYEPGEWAAVAGALPAFASQLTPVFDDGADRVYELRRSDAE